MDSFKHGEITEFIQWHDTDGNIINASDGGIIFAEGKYHWYGQALQAKPHATKGEGGGVTVQGVIMYESEDLLNWKYEGVILGVSNDPKSELYAPLRFERPKIIYNEKTKQYVLWCHYVAYPGDHGSTPGTAEAGVAVCDKVNGEYKWLGTQRPLDGALVRDATLYKDKDGTAYFIYDRHVLATENSKEDRCLYVVKLSDDYLTFTDEYKRIDAASWREAPAIMYRKGKYYIVTSGLTGWAFNQAKAYRTDNLMQNWEDIGDPCIGDDTKKTFNSQSTYAFKVEGTEDTYILMLERHNIKNFLECSYIWLPVKFNEENDTISIEYTKEWKLGSVK